MSSMTLDEMLDHIEQYNGKVFKNMRPGKVDGKFNDFLEADSKIHALLKKFQFILVRLNDSGMTYKLELEDHNYIRVRISYKKVPGYEPGTHTYTGILHITRDREKINPHTGRPWELGDVDYSNPLQPLLTKDGWWTGD